MTKLRLARVARGFRQSDIQSLSSGAIPQQRLSELERGMPARPEEARVLSEVFNLPVSKLGIKLAKGQ
jgi:hypothetical protein